MDDFDEAFNSHFEYFEVKIFVILKFGNEKQLDFIFQKAFVNASVFKVPRYASLEEHKEINELLKTHSKSDSDEITKSIEQSMKSIREVS